MKTLITPAIKDSILDHFVQNFDPGDLISIRREESIMGISDGFLDSVLKQFQSLSLINGLTGTSSSIIFFLDARSHEFISRGGFSGRELLFQKSVENLLLGIEEFNDTVPKSNNTAPQILDGIEKLVSLAANVKALFVMSES